MKELLSEIRNVDMFKWKQNYFYKNALKMFEQVEDCLIFGKKNV